MIGQYPLGGITWHYLQYVLGLQKLGHDVYYIEDTGQWPYNPIEDGTGPTCDYNVKYLARVMERFGLDNRWAYQFVWGAKWFGMSDAERTAIVNTADLILNVSGSLQKAHRYQRQGILAYIDTDPVFTQVKLAKGQTDIAQHVGDHSVHFTYGEDLPSSNVPSTSYDWLPTRQPIVLEEWDPSTTRRETFAIIMNWTSFKPLEYEGQLYGQKDVEFKTFLDLPAKVTPTVLEIAVSSGKTARTPYDLLRHRGWRVVDPAVVCPNFDAYRTYIETSKAEWSAAKGGYVLGQSGWFSE